MQKLVTVLIFVMIVALVALVTIPQWAVKKPEKVLIGHLPDVPNCWLYSALDQGVFQKYKLEPELVDFFSYQEALDSLLGGKLDCFFSFPWSFLLQKMADTLREMSDTMAVAESAAEVADTLTEMAPTPVHAEKVTEHRVIVSFYSTPDSPYGALIVPDNSKLKEVKNLSKKKVGVSIYPHIELEVFLRKALESEIAKKNIRVELAERDVIGSLLDDEKLDAALLYEPDLVRLLEHGKARILVDDPVSAHIINPYPVYAACASDSFLIGKPQTALNFRIALEEAFEVALLDGAALRSSLTNYMRITMPQSAKVRLPHFEKFDGIDRDAIQNFANLLTQENILPDTVHVERLLLKMSE